MVGGVVADDKDEGAESGRVQLAQHWRLGGVPSGGGRRLVEEGGRRVRVRSAMVVVDGGAIHWR